MVDFEMRRVLTSVLFRSSRFPEKLPEFHCVNCHQEIPPGKSGRRCRLCLAQERATLREWERRVTIGFYSDLPEEYYHKAERRFIALMVESECRIEEFVHDTSYHRSERFDSVMRSIHEYFVLCVTLV